MPQLPLAEWQSSLEGMERALEAALAALDRCQAGWEEELARQTASAAPRPALDQLSERLRDWDARLLAATELAASVERELHDRHSAVDTWRQSLEGWHSGRTPAVTSPVA